MHPADLGPALHFQQRHSSPTHPYIVPQLHIPPSTWRFDPGGEAALAASPRRRARRRSRCSSASPSAAAALPAYSPPRRFWEGVAERRERWGFLVAFDEVVTGIGRTGAWFAADELPIEPDIIYDTKGLGAGYVPIGAVLCREHVFEAIAAGSRAFEHGHTWDGAPLSCAVGSAELAYIKRRRLVEHVRERAAPRPARRRAGRL